MNWVQGEWLYAMLLVIPLAGLVALGGWWHRRKVVAAFGEGLAARVLPRSVIWRRRVSATLALLTLLLGCIALAEPAFDKEIVQVKTKGVDLVIALDLSNSMNASDVDPSRLERARREISDLMGLLTGDRVAVVFFAGEAYGRLPLTEDYKAVQWTLQQADTSMFKAQGSQLGKAIDVARELLSRDEGKAGKALLIFSDGETHDPEEAVRAATEAAAEGLTIYSVGIGDAPAPVPGANGMQLVHEGNPVVSTPNFDTLIEVASLTGGAFVKSVASVSDMESLYRSNIRNQIRAVERETQQQEKWQTAFQYPLGLGLFAWLAGAWLGEGRRRYGAAAAVLLAVSLTSTVAQANTVEEADGFYQAQDYGRAAEAFEKLTLDQPNRADLQDRLGAARYRNGDYIGAARAFERASSLRGGHAESEFNAGNARYRAGQLEESLLRYDEALKHAPTHERAVANRKMIEGELATRRAEKPPPPPQEGDSKDEEGEGEGDSEEQQQSQPQEGGDDSEQQEGDSEGQPQDGQQDGEGEPQEGEPQDQEGDPQQGEGTSEGEPQDGSSDTQPGEGSNSDEGPGKDPDEAVNPDKLDGEGEGEGGEPTDEQGGAGEGSDSVGEQSGNITPAQASRMLDGVEEGQQRVQMVGRSSDKPW